MIQKISPISVRKKNVSFNGRRHHTTQNPQYIDERKIVGSLLCIGAVALAGAAIIKHQKTEYLRNLTQIKFYNQAIAADTVDTTKLRNSQVLQQYSRDMAAMKAESLQCRINNGLLKGKSKEAIEHIRNNLDKLKQQAA